MNSLTPVLTQQEAKDFARLHDKKHRGDARQLLIEGERLVEDALMSAMRMHCLIVTSEKEERFAHLAAAAKGRGVEVLRASAKMCEKLSDTPHPQGIFAVAALPATDADAAIDGAAAGKPLFALHGIADPGNLGTILRTTEWFGGSTLLLSEDSVDPFNSKVVRSSMGSVLRLRIGVYSSFDWLSRAASAAGRTLATTAMSGGVAPADFPQASTSLVLLGSEAHGLPDVLYDRIPHTVSIPGGGAESLNIATAHAVLAYAFSLR